MLGFQAAGAAPLVHGAPVEHPETVASAIRIGNPARWEEAMNAMTSSGGAVRAVTDAADPDRPTASWPPARASSASPPRPRASPGCSPTAPARRRRVVCVLTGHGLKDPADRARPGRRGRAVRPRARRDRARGARVTLARRRAGPRSGLVGQPRTRVRRARGGARAAPRARGRRRPARSPSQTDLDVPRDRDNLVVRAFERLHPADDFEFRIASDIPLSGGLGRAPPRWSPG